MSPLVWVLVGKPFWGWSNSQFLLTHSRWNIIFIGGICSSIRTTETLDPVDVSTPAIVRAMENIIDRFYRIRTKKLFIMEQTSVSMSHGPSPIEIAGEIVRFEREHLSMAYVIENHTSAQFGSYHRFFNVFLVDSYESFR